MKPLSLADALASDRLEEFIMQAEAEGLSVDQIEFDARLGELIKAPPQEDQTSRSPARDGSHGKRTR